MRHRSHRSGTAGPARLWLTAFLALAAACSAEKQATTEPDADVAVQPDSAVHTQDAGDGPAWDAQDVGSGLENDLGSDGAVQADAGADGAGDGDGDGETASLPVDPVYKAALFGVQITEDLVYAQGGTREAWDGEATGVIDLHLDVFEPEGAPGRARPALLLIHGGGFKNGDGQKGVNLQMIAKAFVERGWVAFSATYRVVEHHAPHPGGWPLAVQALYEEDQARAIYGAGRDIKAAVRWIRGHAEDYGVHPDYLVALGGSAGAMLAVMLGVSDEADYRDELGEEKDPQIADTHLEQSSRVQAIVDLWGGVSLLSALKSFDGEDRFDASDAPVIILHGTEDSTVPFAEAEDLRARYEEAGAPFAWMPLEGEGHGAWHATIGGKSLSSLAFTFAVEYLGLQVLDD